jgi:L-aminopeptidase/D-esterase-like protein
VVAETYDGATSDINALALTDADVVAALDSALGGPVAEGNVGGGTGMKALLLSLTGETLSHFDKKNIIEIKYKFIDL